MDFLIKNNQVYHFKNTEFFAQNGTIHVWDKKTGKESIVSVPEFKARMLALARFGSGWRASSDAAERDANADCRVATELMHLCIADAESQGDVSKPEVRKHINPRKRLRYDLKPIGMDNDE